MIAWLLTTTALAGGHFHPDAIAGQSKAFARAAEAAPAYEAAEGTSQSIARALESYESNLDLLGERAPAAERERLDQIRTTWGREQAELSDFASALMEDFDMVFTAAMERALEAHPEARMCEATLRESSLPGMPAREKSNPDCTGEDLNPGLAAAMDADPALASQIEELLSRSWPAMTTPDQPQPAIGDTGSWVAVDRFFSEAATPALKAIYQADEDARLPIAAALEDGADPASQLDKARAITEQTAARRAALAAPVLAAADKLASKLTRKGQPSISWCANPIAFGGCEGDNATGELSDALLRDKKVSRALP